MVEALIALALGVVIGTSLGALGAGGSILTVPGLILVLGLSPHAAAATSLVIVGSTAAAGAAAHRRRGSVRLRAGLAFAAAGIAASVVGSALNARTDADALTLAFAGVMAVAAATMWRSALATPHDLEQLGRPRRVHTVAAGSAVGFMTGFFGIGGGFLAVPALTFALRLPIAVAVGTSLLVIALNSGVALVPRIAGGLIDVPVTALVVAGGLLGSSLGARIAHRVEPGHLKRMFAGVVAVTAVVLAAHTLWGR